MTILVIWASLSDGTPSHPANFLLLLGLGVTALSLASVRRYWHIRKTSRSRKDSSLLV